jgi:DNA-binding beta-propeller fold protein YncE
MEKKISQPETFCRLQKAVPGRHSGSGTPMHDRQGDLLCAFPDNDKVQVIDVATLKVVQTLDAGKAVLHMEFTPRGGAVWISARDDNKVSVYDTRSFKRLESLDIQHPSGVFFTHRSGRIGF